MTDRDSYRRQLRGYLTGYLAAGALTALAFGEVVSGGLSQRETLVAIGGLAFAQLVVQLRYFLHIDLGRSSRDDLHLILFSALILLMMAGGTIWLLANLETRMMVMPAVMSGAMPPG